MPLYWSPSQGMINVEGEERVPADAQEVPSYKVGDEWLQWSPDIDRAGWAMPERQNAPAGYVTQLIDLYQKAQQGRLAPEEQRPWEMLEREARAMPARDLSRLAWRGAGNAALDPFAPDIGPILLGILDKQRAGSRLSAQEQEILTKAPQEDAWWAQRANVPQESDVGFGFGDNLFGALAMLGLAASAGTAAPLFAGGAGLGATLGGIGGLAGTAGTLTGMAGEALHLPALGKAGSVLGALGGLAGGAGGLANLWGTGVQSLSDATRLAQSAGRITGSLGRLSGVEPLQQAAKYLGYAGQAGNLASGVLPTSFTDWSGDNSPLAANVAPGVQGLLSAADQATQRGGGMSEWDWTGEPGPLLSNAAPDWWRGGADVGANYSSGGGWEQAGAIDPNWYANTGQYIGGSDPAGGGLWGTLGGLASGALGFLGKNAGVIGPLLSGAGALASGSLGSNAAGDASRLQANALNRGIDLQTAQWLQQQANQAPWLQAGQEALGHMRGRMGWAGPQQPGATPAISGANYALPGTTPGWTPQNFDANAYRWTPGQGPSATNYRYTPGQTPDASQYTYTPGALPTLSGQELLANDPGVAFRLGEGRKALEASAAARGGLLSGPTLAALQRQGQELSSQEYGQAWGRASQQAQMREAWNQQATSQNFGQAMSAAQLREQLQQVATQQGWSQAQTEAVFREQMAQASSQQGFQQGLGAQQWNQGQQQQWSQEQAQRMMQDAQTRYGWDTAQNQTDYQRQQIAYQQQLAELQRQWGQFGQLAGLGQTATNQVGNQGLYANEALGKLYGQLGSTQGIGMLGQAGQWQTGINNALGYGNTLLKNLNA